MSMDDTPPPRASRFREHTNTTSSIRPPPDELWKDLGIEVLIDQFNQENSAPPVRRAHTSVHAMPAPAVPATPRRHSDAPAPAPAEGALGRFWAFWGSVLGKRKAGHVDAEPAPDPRQEAMDARKLAAEQAYHEAKELGLLPAPKVFVRPAMAARARTSVDTPPRAPTYTPRTPSSISRTPSKKDLSKQKKLSKRVSSLEVKLASAKKELQTVLGNECFPAVPALPPNLSALSPTPNTPHIFTDYGSPSDSAALPSHIAKKRRSTTDPATPTSTAIYSPPSTSRSYSLDTDADADADKENSSLTSKSERTIRRVRSASSRTLKRTSSRLSRKLSRSSLAADDATDDEGARAAVVVTVVPGGAVPPVPMIPADVKGRSAVVGVRAGDDGFGGLGHEIF